MILRAWLSRWLYLVSLIPALLGLFFVLCAGTIALSRELSKLEKHSSKTDGKFSKLEGLFGISIRVDN